MTKKVRLPKAVCDALDKVKRIYDIDTIFYKSMERTWFNDEYDLLIKVDRIKLMRALVLGYDPELSAEEEIKRIYVKKYTNTNSYDLGYCDAIKKTLKIHGINYDWMDGDAE